MSEGSYPVAWAGRQAVVTLPEHIDVSNAGRIREELMSVVNRGAAELIADMTATVSCDHAGADAVARVYQRAAGNGTQLRLVVTATVVRRVLSVNGLDRLISIYPSLEAATATPAPAVPPAPGQATTAAGNPGTSGHATRAMSAGRPAGPARGPQTADTPQALLAVLLDALTEGVALTDGNGLLVRASRRLEQTFGYAHAELDGQPVESLIPAELRAAHRSHRAAYAQEPRTRPMGAGMRLVGLRKDGATLPVEVSLAPVPTATGLFTWAVIRDLTEAWQREDLADLARAAVAAQQAHEGQELSQLVVNSLFHVGLSLQEALGLPDEAARRRIAEALRHLDDAIREIRNHAFARREQEGILPSGPPNSAR